MNIRFFKKALHFTSFFKHLFNVQSASLAIMIKRNLLIVYYGAEFLYEYETPMLTPLVTITSSELKHNSVIKQNTKKRVIL